VAASLLVHLLAATGIYLEFAFPRPPSSDSPVTEVEVVRPDQIAPPAPEPPKPEAKLEQPKPQPKPPEPPKPPEQPKPQTKTEPPKPPPFKADPSQVIPATRAQATAPQGDQAAPTNAQRTSENPDKPDTQNAEKAQPAPQPDKPKPDEVKPEEPKQAEVKPEEPKPDDPNGILPPNPPKPTPVKPTPAKPAQTATLPNKPPPSKTDGAARHQTMAPVVVRPDRYNGRAGNSDAPSYPSSARANGLQGRVTLQALVTGDGTVRRINIVKSSGYDELDESAVRAVWLWRFHATGPVPPQGEWIEIPVDFRLH
jgi:TonB family protein